MISVAGCCLVSCCGGRCAWPIAVSAVLAVCSWCQVMCLLSAAPVMPVFCEVPGLGLVLHVCITWLLRPGIRPAGRCFFVTGCEDWGLVSIRAASTPHQVCIVLRVMRRICMRHRWREQVRPCHDTWMCLCSCLKRLLKKRLLY